MNFGKGPRAALKYLFINPSFKFRNFIAANNEMITFLLILKRNLQSAGGEAVHSSNRIYTNNVFPVDPEE